MDLPTILIIASGLCLSISGAMSIAGSLFATYPEVSDKKYMYIAALFLVIGILLFAWVSYEY